MDIFSTEVLVAVVQSLKTTAGPLLDRYFPFVIQSETEKIDFDVQTKGRRIAPFCSPLVPGKVVQSNGFETQTFEPAYVKDKRRLDPNRPLKRVMGETIGGSFSAEERMRILLAADLQDQIDMLTRRQELMACESLRTGKVTVKGDGYPSIVVDFLREATLTPTALASTARWGQSAAKPMSDLENLGILVQKEEGVFPFDTIMGVDAWGAFRADPTVEKRLDVRNVNGNQMTTGAVQEGLIYRGTVDSFNIYTYAGWYIDPDTGTETDMWPADQVVVTTPAIEGRRNYGAIRDPKAGYRAMPYFPKIWDEEDPAVRWLMLQSAPLPAPFRPNASAMLDVM